MPAANPDNSTLPRPSRWLKLQVCALVISIAVVIRWFSQSLTAEELQLVGTWYDVDFDGNVSTVTFFDDRTATTTDTLGRTSTYDSWSAFSSDYFGKAVSVERHSPWFEPTLSWKIHRDRLKYYVDRIRQRSFGRMSTASTTFEMREIDGALRLIERPWCGTGLDHDLVYCRSTEAAWAADAPERKKREEEAAKERTYNALVAPLWEEFDQLDSGVELTAEDEKRVSYIYQRMKELNRQFDKRERSH